MTTKPKDYFELFCRRLYVRVKHFAPGLFAQLWADAMPVSANAGRAWPCTVVAQCFRTDLSTMEGKPFQPVDCSVVVQRS
jgi:hypothetical protein